MEENKIREKFAEEKAIKITEACSDEITQIVRYLTKKFKFINEHPNLSPIAKYIEIQEAIRSPNSGLSRNESNMILTKLFMGMNNDNKNAGGGGIGGGSTNNLSSLSGGVKSSSNEELNQLSTHSIPNMISSPSNSHFTAATGIVSSNSSLTNNMLPLTIPSSSSSSVTSLDYTPIRNNIHTPKFRNSIKSIKFQFSTQELHNAIFEAKKITIMRSLLQEIDIDSTQRLILSLLQEELLKKQKNNEISPDSTYLTVAICYQILENLHELRLNRAQIMFLISLADCYDRDGKHLEIYRFAEHASSIIGHIHDGEVLETRAEVMNLTVIDDRKTFQGLREREFIDEIISTIMHIIENRKHSLIELNAAHSVYIVNHSTKNLSPLHSLSIRESKDEDNEEESIVGMKTGGIDEEYSSVFEDEGKGTDGEGEGEGEGKEEEQSIQDKLVDENEKKLQIISKLDDSTISKDELYEVLRTLPRNKMSDREIVTIIAGIKIPIKKSENDFLLLASRDINEEETSSDFLSLRASVAQVDLGSLEIIPWEDLLHPLVEAIRSFTREHLIHRRVSLVATSISMSNIPLGSSSYELPPGVSPTVAAAAAAAALNSGNNSETTSVAKQKLAEDSMRTLKQLAEKLLNYVKIITSGDGNINLALPIDSSHPAALRRTSSQILSKDDLRLNKGDLNNTEITTLYRCCSFIKFITTRTIVIQPIVNEKHGRKTQRDLLASSSSTNNSSLNQLPPLSATSSLTVPPPLSSSYPSSANLLASCNNISSSNLFALARSASILGKPNAPLNSEGKPTPQRQSSMFGSGNNLLEVTATSSAPSPASNSNNTTTVTTHIENVSEQYIPVFVQVLAIEDTRYYAGSSLVANFITPDGVFNTCETLSMKLPTIGLVDHDAARQFASNLVERMFFEMDEKELIPVFKMNENI
jgi:hypothetical protein